MGGWRMSHMLFAQALLLTFWASWPSPLGPLAPSPPQGHFWAMMSTQEKKNNYFASSDPHQWDLAVRYRSWGGGVMGFWSDLGIWLSGIGGGGQDHITERYNVSRPFPPALPSHRQNT